MENSDLVAGETKVKTAFTTCIAIISLWIGLGVLGLETFFIFKCCVSLTADHFGKTPAHGASDQTMKIMNESFEGEGMQAEGRGNLVEGRGNPESGRRYSHSLETRIRMSINSGRRRAVWVGDVRYDSLQEAAEAEGISYANFRMRLSRGREGYRYA